MDEIDARIECLRIARDITAPQLLPNDAYVVDSGLPEPDENAEAFTGPLMPVKTRQQQVIAAAKAMFEFAADRVKIRVLPLPFSWVRDKEKGVFTLLVGDRMFATIMAGDNSSTLTIDARPVPVPGPVSNAMRVAVSELYKWSDNNIAMVEQIIDAMKKVSE